MHALLVLIALTAQDIPYAPTPIEVVRAMLQLAAPASTDVLVDLGSGDGRIVLEGARLHGIRGLGIEIDARLISESRARAEALGLAHLATFSREDLFLANISAASIVTLYLLPDVNRRLAPQLAGKLPAGARVVSHAFDMGDWNPDSSVSVVHANGESNIYLWIVPHDFRGVWSFDGVDSTRSLELALEQSYQQVSGAGTLNGERVTVRSGIVRGNAIAILLETSASNAKRLIELTGAVEQGSMRVTLRAPDVRAPAPAQALKGVRLRARNEARSPLK